MKVFVDDADEREHDREILNEFIKWYSPRRNDATREFLIKVFFEERGKDGKAAE